MNNIKFKSLQLEAFRAYKEKQTFNFTLDDDSLANLVVIYAPNGFGKTSFFDSLEWGISGKIKRLYENKKVRDVANEEKGNIIKNNESNLENATVQFQLDGKENVKIVSKKLTGVRKRDDVEGDIVEGNEVFKELDKESFIRNNLLTHDKVDDFLRFTNSKDKYTALKSFWDFDGDTEIYIKLLTIIKEFNKKSDDLESQKMKLANEIKELEPNKLIVAHIEKLINKLEAEYNGLISNLKINDFPEMLKEWTRKKAEINQLEDDSNDVLNAYHKLINTFNSDYIEPREILDKTLHEKNRIELIVKLFRRKITIVENKNKIQNELNLLKSRESKFLDIFNNIDNYTEIKNKISEFEKAISDISDGLVNEKDELTKVSNNINDLTSDIETEKNKLLEQTKNISHINNIMTNLDSVDVEKRYLKKLEKTEKYIQKSEGYLVNVKVGIKEKSSFLREDTSILIEMNLSKKLEGDLKVKYDNCVEIYSNLSKTKHKLKELAEKQNSFGDLSSSMDQLLKLGSQIAIRSKKSNCPLCNQSYTDFSELLHKINRDASDYFEIENLIAQINTLENKLNLLEETLVNERSSLNGILENEI